MNTLQKYLLTNTVFSFANGVVALAFQEKLEQIFEVQSGNFFFILGILLLLFALTVALEVKRQRALPVLWIIIQDMLWVIGSIALLIFNPFHVSLEGNVIIGAVALVVFTLGMGQVRGLARMDEGTIKGRKVIRFTRRVKGPRLRVWEVISDVDNYHTVAPNIDRSIVISGEQEGLVRSCSHGTDSWKETCTLWEEGKQYSFVVHTQAPDYPYPLKFLKGTWMVEEVSHEDCEITMVFEFEYKKIFQNTLVHPLMKFKFTKVCNELLDNWQKMIE